MPETEPDRPAVEVAAEVRRAVEERIVVVAAEVARIAVAPVRESVLVSLAVVPFVCIVDLLVLVHDASIRRLGVDALGTI